MRSFLFLFVLLLLSSCEFENIDPLSPIMTTFEPTNIGLNSARLGGRVLGEGGLPVSEYGVVYSESNPPTTDDAKVIEGSRVGSFSNVYSSFQSNTEYYYSAYGINQVGTGYGKIYRFVTDPEVACNPTENNLVNLGIEAIIIGSSNDISINNVFLETGNVSFSANLEFTTFTNSNAIKIRLFFKETNQGLPLSGVYNTVYDIDNQTPFSEGFVTLSVEDFNGLGGGQASEGEQIFVENNNGEITFTLCDLPIADIYNLNGKFTYVE